jgi:signal transduction histidine kinase
MSQLSYYRFFILLTILGLSFSFAHAQFDIGYPLIQSYKATDYKAQPQVWNGTQDSSGIVYFGNNDGVMIFTGSKWEIVPLQNRSIVRSLKLYKNKIAVGGSDDFGFLFRNSEGNHQYSSLVNLLPDSVSSFNDVHSIEQLGDTLYFATEEYIFAYFDNSIDVIQSKWPLRLGLFKYADKLYAYLPGKGLGILNGNTIHYIENSDVLVGRGAVKILDSEHGIILISTVGGAFQIMGNIDTFQLKPIELPCSNFLKTAYIFDVTEVNEQYYAFASLHSGVLITDKQFNPLRIINRDAGLADDVCTRVFPDYSGNLWAITQNGISFLELQSPISVIDERVGINTALTASFFKDSLFYYGSNFRLSYVNVNQKKQGLPNKFKPVGGKRSQIWKVDTVGNHLLVAQRNGLFELKEGRRQLVYDKSGNIWGFKRHPVRKDFLFVGGDSLLVFDVSSARLQYRNAIPSTLSEFRWFVFDKEGRMWVSNSESGIYRLTFNDEFTQITQFEKYDTSSGLPENELNYIWRFENRLVAATINGLYVYNEKTDLFDPWKVVNDLIHNSMVWVVKSDGNGGFYFGGNGGIGQITKDENSNYKLIEVPYNRFDAHILHTLDKHNDSIVAFGFSESALVLNHNKSSKPQAIKFPVISKMKSSHFDVQKDSSILTSYNANIEKIEVPHGDLLTFEYDLPFFTSPDKNRFKTYMDGYDDQWSDWSVATEKEYTNLPHGAYSFRVKAVNVFGVESEESVVSFTILPPWYQTWWAYLLFFGLFAGIILLSIFLYTLRLRRYNAHLEKIVAERTKEIRDKNVKLAALTEFRKTVSHMIVHDLKNPLNVILGLSEKPFVKEAGQIMLNLVNNILDVQKFEDAGMKLKIDENLLSRTVKNAIGMVQLPAEAKEITIINRVSVQIKAHYDAGLIERVFVNLFTNAIKYTPVGGKVIVETTIKGDQLHVYVQDTGKGIDEKMVNKIFEKYTQIDPEKLGVTFSTGLGLNYCKLAVEAHNGTIKAESKPGEGAIFTFTIPQFEIDEQIQEELLKDEAEKKLSLKKEEREKIIDIAPDILNLDVYQRTQLEKILVKFSEIDVQEIQRWSEKLRKAVYDCDADIFESLIKMLKDE